MSVSFPSKPVILLDVPEPIGFKATFVYNFFVPNERSDVTGRPDELLNVETPEGANELRRVVPRLVKFEFSPASILDEGSNEFFRTPFADRGSIPIRENLPRIQSEEGFSNEDFVGIEFQDTNVDRKLFTLVSGSVTKRVAAHNRNVQTQLDASRQTVIQGLTDEHSLLDAARALASATSTGVSNSFIVDALNQIDALKLSFIDDERQVELTNDVFDRIKALSVRTQLNARLVGRIVDSVIDDPMSQFSDEFVAIRSQAHERQRTAIARSDPGSLNPTEYDVTLNSVKQENVDADDISSSAKIAGYLIEKHEVMPDGTLVKHPTIVVQNPYATSAYDTRVAYGRTYIYAIRTVAQVRTRARVGSTSGPIAATGLVKSQRVRSQPVTCIETVPPPPVADFNVVWDYTTDSPLLLWSFPPNPQRDIKKFQVFRRASLEEPFQLLCEIDFDDSEVRAPNPETPEPTLVKRLTSAVTSYRDDSITRDDVSIYAVCCVDAHAFSSNYSMQLEVGFDRFTNRITKQLVSNAGAPKSYPNMFVRRDLFVDTMKTTGHTRMRVFFDPELLILTDNSRNDLQLIAIDNGAGQKYRMQLLNTDVQQQRVVSVTVKDARGLRS